MRAYFLFLLSIFIYFCFCVDSLITQEIFFPSRKYSKENDPCKVQGDGSEGLCLPPSRCRSFQKLMREHGSFMNIACSPVSSNLVCCPRLTRTSPTRASLIDISEPINSPKGCGSIADLSFIDLPDFYRANGTAKRLEAEGYSLTNHVVDEDLLIDFTFTNNSFSGTYSDQFPSPYVIGGNRAERVLARYMAIIGEKTSSGNDWFCDGVLINWQWVLTAAHCFKKIPNIVRLGEYKLEEGISEFLEDPQDYEIKKTVMYPEYKFPSTNHDLALIQLDRLTYIARPDINPICLPWGSKAQKTHIGQQVTLTGWGATQFGKPHADILQEVNITVFNPEVCDRSYSTLRDYKQRFPDGIKPETHLCVGDKLGGKDACQGDSGGPIVYEDQGKYYLAGTVSTGHGCGLKEFPGIYTPINTPKYLDWIKRVAF